MACFSFIEGWCNPVRLHWALGYRSPMAYEAMMEVSAGISPGSQSISAPPPVQ